LYDLVLIAVEEEWGLRDRFCEDVRSATPPQRLAFLVGKPEYLAHLPNADAELLAETDVQASVGDVKAALSVDLGNLTQRWGILEASRRISAVRSACSARSRAMQDRPVPLRDSEGRPSKKTAASIVLENLLRGEMQ